MLGHNVIYVDTICLCGLHGWSSDSHQSNLSFKSQSFLSPWGSVRIKEHAFPRSSPLTFTITAITSLRKNFFFFGWLHAKNLTVIIHHLMGSVGQSWAAIGPLILLFHNFSFSNFTLSPVGAKGQTCGCFCSIFHVILCYMGNREIQRSSQR